MVDRVNAESCCAVAKENREDERIIDCHDAQHHDCVADSKEGQIVSMRMNIQKERVVARCQRKSMSR